MSHSKPNSGITNVEMQYVDLLGNLKNIEVNPLRFEESREYGKNIDGSSVQLVPIEDSDLALKPIPGTEFNLPWNPRTRRALCQVYRSNDDLEECETYPRTILKKQLDRAKERKLRFYTAAEIEYTLLKDKTPTPVDEAGYHATTPLDETKSFRQELFEILPSLDINWEYSHHEVNVGCEITVAYDDALTMADKVLTTKFVGANLASNEGLIFSTMPKPIADVNGNGMHVHMSLRGTENGYLFFDKKASGKLSREGKYFIGGIFDHYRGLTAIGAPTINSRKRLVPGFEAPVYAVWGLRNRSAMIRVPLYTQERAARIEFRMSDCTANPYLLFALLLASGMEGIEKKIDPGPRYDENAYKHEDDLRGRLIPETQEEVLNEFKKDSLIRDVLGENVRDSILKLRKEELRQYHESYPVWNPCEITPWELKKYLVA